MIFANEFISALILAVVQGITEWLPISSSGHLVVFSDLLNFESSLLFDVALHFGTLAAVFVYFGKDIIDIIRDFFTFDKKNENYRLGWMLIIATIPAALLGYFAKGFFESIFSSILVASLGFLVTGLLLFIVSYSNVKKEKLGFGKAFVIGLAQAVSIIPGISRSGATISSGVLLGLSEKQAMKFSFLLSIPIILGANILVVGNRTLSPDLVWATLVSFLVGLLTIHLMFRYVLVKKENFKWFGLYAILLGLILLGFYLW